MPSDTIPADPEGENPFNEVPMPEDTVTGAPPATSDAIGGQINADTFLGVRLVGPFAGMLLANNPGDPGIQEGVDAGLIIPATPVSEPIPPPEPRVPVIDSLSPAEAEHTVAELQFDVIGSNFADGDKVFADDLEASVTFVDENTLTAFFPIISVDTPRSVDIKVVTTEGEESNTLPFEYTEVEGEDTTEGGE